MRTIVGIEAAVFVNDITFDVLGHAFPAPAAETAGLDRDTGIEKHLKCRLSSRHNKCAIAPGEIEFEG